LLSNNFYYPNVLGGAEVSTQTLGEALAARGHSVRVLCLSGTKKTEHYTHNGVAVIALGRALLGTGPTAETRSPLGRVTWHLSAAVDLGWQSALMATIAEQPTDIVNTFNVAGTTTRLWGAVKTSGLPLVHTLFGTYLACFRGSMFKGGRDCGTQCMSCRILTRKRRRASILPDAVVGDSRAVLDRHLVHGYFDGIAIRQVINCGFTGTSNAAPPPRPRHAGAPLRIGFMGRLHPTKGLDVLLTACERLGDGPWQLRIAGNGPPETEARLRALANPRIRFLGWQNTGTFLANTDVSVVPSIWNDPLPRVVFESFSAGVPVVGSQIGGIPEMIEEATQMRWPMSCGV
jgi:glycosyltransferase involved in cell wall biosynthesis